MNNAVWQKPSYKIFNNIESCQQSQSDCDNRINGYKELCDVITKEMDRHLQYFTSNKNILKKL